MKIAIVGAGLSGLATAIALRKYIKFPNEEGLEVKVYEKADASDIGSYGFSDQADLRLKKQGAAISLQANALRTLRTLDPALADRVQASGYPCTHFIWKTAGDYVLGREYMNLLPVSRPMLVACLQDFVPPDTVQFRTVARISAQEGQKPIIHFQDGGPDEIVDLVVGADGIRSVVRHSLLGDDEQYHPKYLGMSAVGGVLDDISLPASDNTEQAIVFIEGQTGFFGYSRLSQEQPGKLLYFSLWDPDLTDRTRGFDHKLVTDQMRERHQDWKDPNVQRCLQRATLDNIWPVFYLPDLPHWGRDGCVLVGDAAHAMPPASGQGGSQALEDGLSFALLLAAFVQRHDAEKATSRSIHALYDLRHRRLNSMKARALRLQEPRRPMSLMRLALMYATLFLMLQMKRLASVWGGAEDVRSWDASLEVEQYLRGVS